MHYSVNLGGVVTNGGHNGDGNDREDSVHSDNNFNSSAGGESQENVFADSPTTAAAGGNGDNTDDSDKELYKYQKSSTGNLSPTTNGTETAAESTNKCDLDQTDVETAFKQTEGENKNDNGDELKWGASGACKSITTIPPMMAMFFYCQFLYCRYLWYNLFHAFCVKSFFVHKYKIVVSLNV